MKFKYLAALIVVAGLSTPSWAQPSIVGDWLTSYYASPSGYMVQQEVNAQANNLVFITRAFSNAIPNQPMAYETRYYFRYQIGNPNFLATGTYEFDQFLQTRTLIPRSTALVLHYNRIQKCGFSNWQMDVEQDLLTLRCDIEGPEFLYAGDTRYNILKVEGNHMQWGYFAPGDDRTGTSPNNRPRDLDTQMIFTKIR